MGQIGIMHLLLDAQKRAQHHFWGIPAKNVPQECDHEEALGDPDWRSFYSMKSLQPFEV